MEKFITLQKVKRKRKHGFRVRMKSKTGQDVLKRRRAVKRKRISL